MNICKDINKFVDQNSIKPKAIQKKMPIFMLNGIRKKNLKVMKVEKTLKT